MTINSLLVFVVYKALGGGVGISEGVFLKLYRRIYAVGAIKSAMLLSRGISFYLVIIMTEIILVCNQMIDFWRMRREGK